MCKKLSAIIAPLLVALLVIVVTNWNVGDFQKIWIIFITIFSIVILVEVAGYLAIDVMHRTTNMYTLVFHSLIGGVFVLGDLYHRILEDGINWSAVNEGAMHLSIAEKIFTSDITFWIVVPCFLIIQLIVAVRRRRMVTLQGSGEAQRTVAPVPNLVSVVTLVVAILLVLVMFNIFT
jgi:hypothetical protein